MSNEIPPPTQARRVEAPLVATTAFPLTMIPVHRRFLVDAKLFPPTRKKAAKKKYRVRAFGTRIVPDDTTGAPTLQHPHPADGIGLQVLHTRIPAAPAGEVTFANTSPTPWWVRRVDLWVDYVAGWGVLLSFQQEDPGGLVIPPGESLVLHDGLFARGLVRFKSMGGGSNSALPNPSQHETPPTP